MVPACFIGFVHWNGAHNAQRGRRRLQRAASDCADAWTIPLCTVSALRILLDFFVRDLHCNHK